MSRQVRQSWSIGAYMRRVENTEVIVDVIGGGAPELELEGGGEAVIVTI